MSIVAASGSKPEAVDNPVAERTRRGRWIGPLIVVFAIVTSLLSFLVLTGQTDIEPTPLVVRSATFINLAVVLTLIGLITYEAAGLWIARRRGRAAARLHVRIVLLFTFIAALPAVLMAIVASITLNEGLDRWFAERTKAIIDTSRSVAQAYVQEHSRVLALDLLAIAGEFNRVTPNLTENAGPIAAYLGNQAQMRGLSAIELIRGDRSTIVAGETTTNLEVPPPPVEIFAEAETGQPALIAPGTTNLVGGVIKLTGFDDVYLYLARPIDPRVSRYVRLTEENAAEYERLQENRFGVQIVFAILFVGMALVMVLSAIWIGLGFARGLVSPIRRLIGATQQISAGNLDVHVPTRGSQGDLSALASTFNTMTSQLKSQRNELLAAHDKIDERRRFTEAVLSGVSAGVIGLDASGRVTLVNRSALAALDFVADDLVGRPVTDAIPALSPLLDEARQKSRGQARAQIQLARGGEQRTFNVQVTQEHSDGRIEGLVVTLDDITDLMAAQRRSAWADVARRIAHEIKNPLTPIQLSAERLKRRFGGRVEADDRKVFDQCTETIVRQVGDIRRMVDEFSGFARMPKPIMEDRDLNEVVREAVFLQEVAKPNIRFKLELPDEPVLARVDHRLVTQALTNIVKNATEAIEAAGRLDSEGGLIVVRVGEGQGGAVIDVEDNGKGLPAEDREKLLEPYMTTREKGTGLGLAIVRKIMEEHSGSVALLDSRAGIGKGALVRLSFPRALTAERAAPADAPSNETTTETV
jgi:two-component system, NtrC family, nitrogen regulation sensor histidine kinase NtrY